MHDYGSYEDLVERIERAQRTLHAMTDNESEVAAARLAGKVQGLALALSYLKEARASGHPDFADTARTSGETGGS